METEILNILSTWQRSLIRFKKIDDWQLCGNLRSVGEYIINNEAPRESRNLVRQIRDCVITNSFDATKLVEKIERLMCSISGEKPEKKSKKWKKNNNGQQYRFRNETKKIFMEELKFRDGMPIRKLDIETESPRDSRKVRRIIEKRMCQAYYRMNREEHGREDNNERYWMRRATSFQLHNIGQIEHVKGVSRGESTHWKKTYDPNTGEVVMKKKMAYSTREDALEAIKKYLEEHPENKGELSAYFCPHCHKWHIGHNQHFKETNNNTEEYIS